MVSFMARDYRKWFRGKRDGGMDTHAQTCKHMQWSCYHGQQEQSKLPLFFFFCELLIQVCFHNRWGGEVGEKVRQ